MAAHVAVTAELVRETATREQQLATALEQHPSAEILRSLPGLGGVLGARVLAEFADDPHRYADAKARKNYLDTAPITRASGESRVVLARVARNRRLADTHYQWAFSALTRSPGARALYDQQAPEEPPTTPPGVPWPTGSSGSCTAAYATAPPTTRPPPGRDSTSPTPKIKKSPLDTLRTWGYLAGG